MSKRAPNFEKKDRDYYPTPKEAVIPLIPHLPHDISFVEPCAGDGSLVDHIEARGIVVFCNFWCDIEPQSDDIFKQDALTLSPEDVEESDYIITNPPWSWEILDQMITHFRSLRPTWLLLSADVAHNKRMGEHMKYCAKMVSVGRVKWIPDSPYAGKDNCAWYLFHRDKTPTIFIGR